MKKEIWYPNLAFGDANLVNGTHYNHNAMVIRPMQHSVHQRSHHYRPNIKRLFPLHGL